MKKLRLRGLDNPDCATRVQHCVQTSDGFEDVHINMATGEISYSPGTCVDENLLREAFAREGLEVEEMK